MGTRNKICHTLVAATKNAIINIFRCIPIASKKIVFINFNGKGYGCNPKYIAQEIIAQELDYDLVWLVNDTNEVFPKGIRKVCYRNIRALYELASARVIITNVKNDLRLKKKSNQYIIQTWHASYSSKYVEKEAEDKLSTEYLRESEKNSAETDLFLSNSRVMSQCYRDAFWCECEIMECGFPRNDILFTKDDSYILRIKERLGLANTAKIVIYAPTFRDDDSVDAYSLDCLGLLNTLKSINHQDWKLLTRLHPNVIGCNQLFPKDKDIINVNTYPDMQELLLAADILITDYSSTPFDFATMGKQVYIYAPDIEQYQKMRGLKDDFFTMPYQICRTNQELLELMQNYSPENAKKDAERFMKCFGGVDNGDASKQVVERIKQVISV